MLSRIADHLIWMSRYTERAGDMPQAFAGMAHQLREALVSHHQNTPSAPALAVFEAQ